MWPNLQFPADLVTLTEENLMENFNFSNFAHYFIGNIIFYLEWVELNMSMGYTKWILLSNYLNIVILGVHLHVTELKSQEWKKFCLHVNFILGWNE